MIAHTPEPPYYAVIFTSVRTEQDDNDYHAMAGEMVDLARKQKGFLGMESARNEIGITVSYWETLEDIKVWRENERHLVAQKNGREKWYHSYATRICKVERAYRFGQEAEL